MKVLVYEPGHGGHRLNYVRLVIAALLDIGVKPTLAVTQKAMDSEDFKENIKCYADLVDFEGIGDAVEGLGVSRSKLALVSFPIKQFNILNDTLDRVRPDHVLIPTAGQLMWAFAYKKLFLRKFKIPQPVIEALFLGPGHGYDFTEFKRRVSNPAIEWVSRRMPIKSYFHADPYQLKFMAKGQADPEKFVVMPDPVPKVQHVPSKVARESLKIPTDGRYIGICGGISAAKGVHDLVHAFKLALPELSLTDRLLFAGAFDDETRKFVFQENRDLVESQRIVAIDKFLSGEEMDLALNAMDLFCVAQQGRPGSSGTLLRAIVAGKPVLARDRFWSGRITKEFHLGWVSETWNHGKFSKSLLQCLAEIDDFEFLPKSHLFMQFHSEQNFQATWLKNIRQRMGLPPDVEMKQWSAVEKLVSDENRK